MGRPTWDDLKLARDGSTTPLRTLPGETAGDAHYRMTLEAKAGDLRAEHERLHQEFLDLDRKWVDLRDRKEAVGRWLDEVLAELEDMGVETGSWKR